MSSNGKQRISSGGSGLPSRVIFHGTEGIGKTSLGAAFTRPIFSMARNETGLLTLIDNGLIGPTDHFEEAFTWMDLLGNIRHLVDHDTAHKTYVIDTLNGAERLCMEHVCKEKFSDDWSKFLAYSKGVEESLKDWLGFLSQLDFLRRERRMAILVLCHTKVKKFANPEGEDYDRYTPDMNDKYWGLSHKWADVVLFGNYITAVKKERAALKAKATGGNQRFMYTTRTAAYDAKNRGGLPSAIPMGTNGKDSFAALKAAMVKAKQRASENKPPEDPEDDVLEDGNNSVSSGGVSQSIAQGNEVKS